MKTMLKVTLTIPLFFLITLNSYSQIEKQSLFIDSVEVIKFVEFTGKGKKIKIIAYDQYFIYKDSLYNNPIETDLNICNVTYPTQVRKIARLIDTSSFYKNLLSNNSQKQSSIKEFLNSHPTLFKNDSMIFSGGKMLDSNLCILSKKELIVFLTFECSIINMDELAGGGTHSKFLEKYLYSLWNRKFLLPILFTN